MNLDSTFVTLAILLPAIAATGALLLATWMLLQDWETFTHRIFGLGMLALGLEQIFTILATNAVILEKVLFWSNLSLPCAAVTPGLWLFFTYSLARPNGKDRKDVPTLVRWLVLPVLGLPLFLVFSFWNSFFSGYPVHQPPIGSLIRLGPGGHVFHLFLILGSTVVLAGLERTFRAAVGQARWEMKFLLLGLGSIFAIRIYTSSQSLLFSAVATKQQIVEAAALLVAIGLMTVSLRRVRIFRFGLHLSKTLLTQSITVVLVGVYLLSAGVLVQLIGFLGWEPSLPLDVLLFFLALVVLGVLLLSDRLRQTVRLFASRHLRQPNYDYRQVWTQFAKRTASAGAVDELTRRVADFVSETFQILSVTVWLVPEGDSRLVPAATTSSNLEERRREASTESMKEVLARLRRVNKIVDLEGRGWSNQLRRQILECLDGEDLRYLVPLWTQGRFLGVVTLGDAVRRRVLSVEDFDLLQVVAHQAASSLLNLQLAERLQQARQLEAFQQMSAFFVHDLKNLASRLSLTMQNLPLHFDNPEFREDALQAISHSLERISSLTGHLSLIREGMELNCSPADLNQILRSVISELSGNLGCTIIETLDGALPQTRLDVQQIQKVVTNLLLNASEASPKGGKIRVGTHLSNGSVMLTVQDKGEGMSAEFIQNRLFHPFETTKKNGIGIGLFHSKTIVEAHQGRIEVESQQGEGSTFRVLLPAIT